MLWLTAVATDSTMATSAAASVRLLPVMCQKAKYRRLAERGAWANVKPMPRRVSIPAFSPFLYRYRNLVERFFNKMKHFRAVAARICIRFYDSVT